MRQPRGILAWSLTLSVATLAMADAAPSPAAPAVSTPQQQTAFSRIQTLLAPDDLETQARVSELLQFQEGLASWTAETLKLPEEQARIQLDFCLQPEVITRIAGLFSNSPSKRSQAVRALAAFEGAGAEGMLLRLLEGRDRNVAMIAIEAIQHRKPTPAAVEVLWDRGVEEWFRQHGLAFARKTQPRASDMSVAAKACDVLEAWKTPYVNPKLKEMLERIEASTQAVKPSGTLVFGDKQPPMSGPCDLLIRNKPPEVVPVLMRIISGKAHPGGSIGIAGNVFVPVRRIRDDAAENKEETTFFWTSRTLWIAMLLEITGQSTEDYGLKRCRQIGNFWTFTTAADEEKAVMRLQEWWRAHRQTYEAAAASQPAGKVSTP